MILSWKGDFEIFKFVENFCILQNHQFYRLYPESLFSEDFPRTHQVL